MWDNKRDTGLTVFRIHNSEVMTFAGVTEKCNLNPNEKNNNCPPEKPEFVQA